MKFITHLRFMLARAIKRRAAPKALAAGRQCREICVASRLLFPTGLTMMYQETR